MAQARRPLGGLLRQMERRAWGPAIQNLRYNTYIYIHDDVCIYIYEIYNIYIYRYNTYIYIYIYIRISKNHDILAAFHLKNLVNSITFRRTSSHRSLRIWADLGAEKMGISISWDMLGCKSMYI